MNINIEDNAGTYNALLADPASVEFQTAAQTYNAAVSEKCAVCFFGFPKFRFLEIRAVEV